MKINSEIRGGDMLALSNQTRLVNLNTQGRFSIAEHLLSLNLTDNLEKLSPLVAAGFFKVNNRRGSFAVINWCGGGHKITPPHQLFFASLRHNAKQNLSKGLKIIFQLAPFLLQTVERSLVFNFSKGVFQDVGNFVQERGKKNTKREQTNEKGGSYE